MAAGIADRAADAARRFAVEDLLGPRPIGPDRRATRDAAIAHDSLDSYAGRRLRLGAQAPGADPPELLAAPHRPAARAPGEK